MNVDAEEFEFLKRKASALGLYIQEHRQYDPCIGGGPLYIQRKKKFGGEHVDTLLRYATPEKAWEFLNTYEQVQRETSQ
jgi:hypothetical protein